MSISLKEITSNKDIKLFIDFPHDLYKDDPHYVPELFIAQKELLSPKKNPFYQSGATSLFLAYKDSKIVGRIAAIDNPVYNDYHNSNVGFFGMFDCIDDQEVANKLLETAKSYHLDKNRDSVIGPTNLTTNETAGVLIEGYDSPPVVMMTYNKSYYSKLLEQAGYGKEMDLFAYKIPTKSVSKKSIRISQMLEERLNKRGITIRDVKMKNFKAEVHKIREIYNSAWAKNWGFVPSSKEEFDHLAESLKLIVNTEFCYLAEFEGKPIGFMLALPNLNETLIKVKRGRLLPFGLFKILMGKSKFKIVRVITLGVVEEFRKAGIEGIFYSKVIQAAQKYNVDFGEASWILENNEMMNQGVNKLNGEKYKTYRIYSKSIS